MQFSHDEINCVKKSNKRVKLLKTTTIIPAENANMWENSVRKLGCG